LDDLSAYDDKALFQRVSDGDEASFTALFHSYTPRLYAYLIKVTRDEHLARELVQETFLKLWTKRDYLKELDSPSAYLYRIAANLSINHFKQEHNRKRIRDELQAEGAGAFSTENHFSTEEVITGREVSGIIARAVASLPEKRQEIFRLSREQGLTHDQIATRLGLSVQTVKNQVGSALKAIQAAISKETGLSIAVVALLLGL
jgi:RNA polymerase sigma-70 factor (family 1)